MDVARLIADWLSWADAHATFIQAIASIAAVIVAVAAALAATLAWTAERSQAMIAKKALAAAENSERSARRDVQILAARPLLIGTPSVTTEGGEYMAVFPMTVSSDRYVLGLKFIIRHDEIDYAGIKDVGSVGPGGQPNPMIPIGPFLGPPPSLTHPRDPHEVIVEHRGSVGQRVIEHYEWDMGSNGLLGGSSRGTPMALGAFRDRAEARHSGRARRTVQLAPVGPDQN